MSVIYKMEWVRFDVNIPWFEDGFKDGLYKEPFDKMFKDLVSSGKAIKMEYSESDDKLTRYFCAETGSELQWENLKSSLAKRYPTYQSDSLEYNLTHGIFCVPENCGISIDGGPLIGDL
jgi:hypothetical protein